MSSKKPAKNTARPGLLPAPVVPAPGLLPDDDLDGAVATPPKAPRIGPRVGPRAGRRVPPSKAALGLSEGLRVVPAPAAASPKGSRKPASPVLDEDAGDEITSGDLSEGTAHRGDDDASNPAHVVLPMVRRDGLIVDVSAEQVPFKLCDGYRFVDGASPWPTIKLGTVTDGYPMPCPVFTIPKTACVWWAKQMRSNPKGSKGRWTGALAWVSKYISAVGLPESN